VPLDVDDLPHLNATLNALAMVFLAAGFYFIKTGERDRHRACMLAALAVSTLFLVSYVIYKLNSGFAQFGGEGVIRPIYFTILIVHVLGAFALTPLVPVLVYRAWSQQFDRHRRLARWTWPLWMYVSVSGVVVYAMAVHFFPHPAGPYAHG
jgi:putative membrane protein